MTLLPPLFPLRSGSSIAAFPFPGPVSTAVYSVPGSLVSHCCFTNYLHRRCVKGLVRPAFHAQLLWIRRPLGP